MRIHRRQFLGSVPAVAAAASLSHAAQPDPRDDPLGVRRDFPLCGTETYLNTAYMSPIPTPVEQAGVAFVRSKCLGPISLGEMLAATDAVRGKFAALLGAVEEEIGFLFATSEGENLVARALGLRAGDNVVVDELHYMTTFVLYQRLAETLGVELRIARQIEGAVPREAFEPLVDRRTRLVSVAWVSHQNGFRHDLRSLADLAHAHGAYLYTDAVQAVGMFPMSLHDDGVDFLTTGTYKWLLAGYGVAPFYLRRELLERIPPDRMGALHVEKELGEYRYQIYRSAKKFEYATLAFGEIYQLGAALDYLKRVGIERIETHTVALAHDLRRGLVERGYRVNTPEANRSSIVTFVHGKDSQAIGRRLEQEKVRVSLRDAGAQIRVGVALFNNRSDVQTFLDVMDDAAKSLSDQPVAQ